MVVAPDRIAAMDAVRALLAASGVDPDVPMLADTPARVAASLRELFAGVGEDATAPLRRGDAVPEGLDIVCLRGIEFRSVCAHHLLPFSGTVDIAYLPVARLVGIGAIVRTLEILSTRPQIQEHLADELAQALHLGMDAAGALVVFEARHSCVADRGPREAGSVFTTVASSGVLGADGRRQDAIALLRRTRAG